jgi:hypothetical protein
MERIIRAKRPASDRSRLSAPRQIHHPIYPQSAAAAASVQMASDCAVGRPGM